MAKSVAKGTINGAQIPELLECGGGAPRMDGKRVGAVAAASQRERKQVGGDR